MPQEQPAEEKKPNYWVIGLIVVLIIAALGAGAYFITRAGSDDEVGYVFDGAYRWNGQEIRSQLRFDERYNSNTQTYEYTGSGKDDSGTYKLEMKSKSPLDTPADCRFTKDYGTHRITYTGRIYFSGIEMVES